VLDVVWTLSVEVMVAVSLEVEPVISFGALSDIATWHFVSNLLSFSALDIALARVSVCFTFCPIGH